MFSGKSRDGSDMKAFRGMFVSPDGDEWQSHPYTKEQYEQDRDDRKLERIESEIYQHLVANRRSYKDEYDLVLQKKSSLSYRCRMHLIEMFNNPEKYFSEEE